MTPTDLILKCPVCGARFRDTPACGRCGTDLSHLMRLAARAGSARRRCRASLQNGDLADALRWDALARRLHRLEKP